MRLAIVNQDYRADEAHERMQEPALEALLARNVAISLYTRAWPATKLQLIEPFICNPFHIGAYWRDRGFARAACRAIRRARPDLVESRHALACCDVYHAAEGVRAVRVAEEARRAPAIARAIRRASPHERYQLAAERRLYRSRWLRAVICHSRMVRDEIVGCFGFPEEKVHVVYPPVDGDAYRPADAHVRAAMRARLGIDADALVYVAVADEETRDGIARTMDVLAALPERSRLIVLGDAARLARIRRRTHAQGVARLTFAAATDPRPYFAAADAFVRPSLYEPSPMAPLAAMASGLAIVTGAKSGAAELAREYACGLVCETSDADELAAHLRALADAELRARLGRNARSAVLPLSPPAITLELVLLYRDLLAAAVAERVSDDAVRAAAAEPGLRPAPPE